MQTCTKCSPIGSLTYDVERLAWRGERWDAPIEHGIERRNLVYPHGRHGKKLSDIVHNADTCPSLVLSLCEVEERNDGCLLILRWIIGNDFSGPCEIFRSELKGNLREEYTVIRTSK